MTRKTREKREQFLNIFKWRSWIWFPIWRRVNSVFFNFLINVQKEVVLPFLVFDVSIVKQYWAFTWRRNKHGHLCMWCTEVKRHFLAGLYSSNVVVSKFLDKSICSVWQMEGMCLVFLCFMPSLVLLHIIRFQEVGCDHILYSEKEKDRCGICDGNGDSCTLVQSIYSKNYMRGKILNRSCWVLLLLLFLL